MEGAYPKLSIFNWDHELIGELRICMPLFGETTLLGFRSDESSIAREEVHSEMPMDAYIQPNATLIRLFQVARESASLLVSAQCGTVSQAMGWE